MTLYFTIPRKGTGNGRVLAIDSIKNSQGNIFNKYVAGAGVGATSVSVRRAKIFGAAAKRQEYSLSGCVYNVVA